MESFVKIERESEGPPRQPDSLCGDYEVSARCGGRGGKLGCNRRTRGHEWPTHLLHRTNVLFCIRPWAAEDGNQSRIRSTCNAEHFQAPDSRASCIMVMIRVLSHPVSPRKTSIDLVLVSASTGHTTGSCLKVSQATNFLMGSLVHSDLDLR